MLKVGVLGAGHLGKIHLKLLKESSFYELLGFYDPDENNTVSVVDKYGFRSFKSIEELIEHADVVDIVTPTLSHFKCAKQAVIAGKHIFVEKPIANTVVEAENIINLAKRYNVKGQVGHVERFNPAFVAARPLINAPMFIEVHRLAEFNPRGTDVPVVFDLMIHDIDIILSIVKSPISHISAGGVEVVSKSPDIANARIEFENGCVANLTSSRISMKSLRKARFFQKEAYISVDFLNKKTEVVRMQDASYRQQEEEFAMILQNAEGERKRIYFDYPEIHPNNAILDELESFARAINDDVTPVVSLEQGSKALKVATQIVKSFRL